MRERLKALETNADLIFDNAEKKTQGDAWHRLPVERHPRWPILPRQPVQHPSNDLCEVASFASVDKTRAIKHLNNLPIDVKKQHMKDALQWNSLNEKILTDSGSFSKFVPSPDQPLVGARRG